MKVIKRDGRIEEFNIDKIIDAIKSAYIAQGYKAIPGDILKEIDFTFLKSTSTVWHVEDIQDLVEETLMGMAPYKVAKSYKN